MHTIIGAGAAEGAVDAANILKPALARGEIQCIGATTLKEYKKYIERDSALERRFQNINVDEPSVQDTIRILSGLRKSYEKHHSVRYTKESVKAAVRMADRFISDRYLPDKAIDVIDEAGARARLESAMIPEEIQKYEKDIATVIKEKNDMVKLQEYEQAAKLRDSIVNLEKEYSDKLETWRVEQKTRTIEITEDIVVNVLSDWTGIPLQQLAQSETDKLLKMEDQIKDRVVGQTDAIEKISKAVRRARTGFKSKNRPIGSFIFLGPTGVGKTELAKALAEFMFGDEDALVRFDMSEYMEMHSVSKFIGSPPGYIGYEEGGQLTEAVRRKPYSILLFDEIEKAHPEIQNILLQVLDEGELTDTMGHHVDFKETLIIMTSNLGARALMKGGKVGFEGDIVNQESKNDQVLEEMKRHFSPEFLNRIDDIIVFSPLKKEELRAIVEIAVEEINSNIVHKELYLDLDKKAKDYLADHGYNEKYGARPLNRLLQKEIEDELANRVLVGQISKPTKFKITVSKDKLLFKASDLKEEELLKLKKKYLVAEESIDNYWEDDENIESDPETEAELAPT